MKKFRYHFHSSAFVIYALIVLASITAIVFAALRLAGVGDLVSVYPAVDIASIVIFALFVALIGYYFFSVYYTFTADSFVVVQLFSRKAVARDALCKLTLDEASGLAALYYVDEEADPDVLPFIAIDMRRKDLDAFIADLRAFKSDIVIESIPQKKEEK